MAFNRSFDPFDSIPKMIMAGGMVVVAVALSILLGDVTHQLTGRMEIGVAVVGCVVMSFAYLSWKILRDG